MYPIIRLAWQRWLHRNSPPLGLFGTHVSRHICWPWDIDLWMELNNGRTLTLYDLGRVPASGRTGLAAALRAQGWGMAVAGASVRYRRRVRAFDRIIMQSRALGWDDRFVYSEQSMWKSDGECASHILIRSAVTDRQGIVAPDRLARALGWDGPSPDLPDWAREWTRAEALRPWPPVRVAA